MIGGSHLSNCSIEFGHHWWYFELLPWKLKDVSPASDQDYMNRLRRIDQELNSLRHNSTLISCTIFIRLPIVDKINCCEPILALLFTKRETYQECFPPTAHQFSVRHLFSSQEIGFLWRTIPVTIQSGSSFFAKNCQFSCCGALSERLTKANRMLRINYSPLSLLAKWVISSFTAEN